MSCIASAPTKRFFKESGSHPTGQRGAVSVLVYCLLFVRSFEPPIEGSTHSRLTRVSPSAQPVPENLPLDFRRLSSLSTFLPSAMSSSSDPSDIISIRLHCGSRERCASVSTAILGMDSHVPMSTPILGKEHMHLPSKPSKLFQSSIPMTDVQVGKEEGRIHKP